MKVLISTNKYKKITVNVMIVQKCNFNDTFYIESKDIYIKDLIDKEVEYFDPFLGKSKNTNIKVAILAVDDEGVTYSTIENGLEEKETYKHIFDKITTADNDETTFLASHIATFLN